MNTISRQREQTHDYINNLPHVFEPTRTLHGDKTNLTMFKFSII